VLLVEALKLGVTVGEFWDMTPRETFMALNASVWRIEQEMARSLVLAWNIAALERTKRLPPLSKLLAPVSDKKQVPIEDRRNEFEELKDRMDPGRRRT